MKVPTPPLVVADNDVVEALRVELAKCKLDHKRDLELVHIEHANEVHGLKAWIEVLTNLARVNSEQQGLSTWAIIEGASENIGGQGQPPSTNLKTIRVNYGRIIRRNRMLEDDYMGMVTTTLM